MYKWTKEVENALELLCEKDGYGEYALFDADGTLWPEDLGESFFLHQIKHQLAPGLKGMKNPWASYCTLDQVSTADANAWIVKLNAGLSLGVLRDQAKDFYKAHFKSQLNPLMAQLISKLKSKNYEVLICSASMRWAIEPALYDLDLPLENLTGTECEINHQGYLTNTIVTPIPYGSGKKFSLLKKLNKPPLFVAGNSLGDIDLLNWAKDMPLVIQYEPGLPSLVGSERSLRNEAELKGWPIQIFKRS